MKKFTLFASALLLGTAGNAQIFQDNFDSYAVGSYLCPQSPNWRTWSGTGNSSAEDVKISDAQANSGANSVYFSSTAANGGPQDILLDFVQIYNSGVFSLKSSFYVNAGKSGYFNIQGNATLGNSYALDVFMENGTISVQNSGTVRLLTPFAHDTWFNMEVVCNLTTKIWELKINGVSVGKWTNTVNTVRFVDYFPLNGSQFYLDDVSFDQVTYTPSTLNASTAALVMGSNFAGTNGAASLVVANTGTTQITSFDAVLNYNGQTYTQNMTGLTLAANQTTSVALGSIPIVAGINPAVATISNINGGNDDNASDNSTSIVVKPIVPALGKKVISEEGTGTWCQYCPRGDVFMKQFDLDYGTLDLWQGIAVHNNDPMDIGNYDGSLAFTGYPNAKVDRVSQVDPSAMYPSFEQRIQIAPIAFVEVGANYTAATRVLQVSGKFNFQQATSQAYKVAFVLTEDSIRGTGSGYSQVNFYSGGTVVMGGYELLPNPVPYSQMFYDHVARDIRPSFGGFTGSFPGTVAQGSEHTVRYSFGLPATWNTNKMHIIVLLIAPNGTIENAGSATIAEATTNGFEPGGTNAGSSVGLIEISQIDASFQMYPNPTSDKVNMVFQLQNEADVTLTITDISGKTIASRAYGKMTGASSVNFNTNSITPGIYLVNVTINDETITRRLIVE